MPQDDRQETAGGVCARSVVGGREMKKRAMFVDAQDRWGVEGKRLLLSRESENSAKPAAQDRFEKTGED
jgi:hypothetical protein